MITIASLRICAVIFLALSIFKLTNAVTDCTTTCWNMASYHCGDVESQPFSYVCNSAPSLRLFHHCNEDCIQHDEFDGYTPQQLCYEDLLTVSKFAHMHGMRVVHDKTRSEVLVASTSFSACGKPGSLCEGGPEGGRLKKRTGISDKSIPSLVRMCKDIDLRNCYLPLPPYKRGGESASEAAKAPSSIPAPWAPTSLATYATSNGPWTPPAPTHPAEAFEV